MTEQPLPPPGFVIRMAAALYDGLLVIALWMVAALLALLPVWAFSDAEYIPAGNPLFQAWLVVVTGLFFAWFWARAGQTLGMKAWRLRVVDQQGRGLSGRPLWLRLALVLVMVVALIYATTFLTSEMWPNWLGVLCLVPVVISCCWALVDPERRMLHDILSGTRVIRIPRSV